MSMLPSTRSRDEVPEAAGELGQQARLVGLGGLLAHRDRGDHGGGDREARGVDEGDQPAAGPREQRGAEQRAEEPERLLDRLQAGVGVDQQLLGHHLLEQPVEGGGQHDERDAVEERRPPR